MEIRIFDVAHGFCAYLVADNGNVMLIDCGHNDETGFRPSSYLPDNRCIGIEKFVVSNYDEDHLSDLPNLRRRLPIQVLRRNRSVNAEELRHLKLQAGPLGPGMEAMLDMIRTYNADVTTPPEFPEVEMAFFCNSYPTFSDTNNLSLVTFVHYRGIHIVFPGDLERPGWRALLRKPAFLHHLRRVNLFVASHHGRESGYCEEAFRFCQPALVIVSDESIQYDTQRVNYTRHASGMRLANGTRYVLTTRNDGMITIRQRPGETIRVSTSRRSARGWFCEER